IYDDTEQCQIRIPGNRSTQPYFPAHAVSHWHTDPYTGGQRQGTYAERFDHEYRQFKEHATQTKTGTPLTEMPTLREGRRAELRALNIYTVEQLAGVDGQELKNLGQGGRELKNLAEEYIAQGRARASDTQMQAELEGLRARNQVLEDDNRTLKSKVR